jgi:hypothetical protein
MMKRLISFVPVDKENSPCLSDRMGLLFGTKTDFQAMANYFILASSIITSKE